MSFPTKAKYVIIGAGIHGLSTAWHLAEKIKKKEMEAITTLWLLIKAVSLQEQAELLVVL